MSRGGPPPLGAGSIGGPRFARETAKTVLLAVIAALEQESPPYATLGVVRTPNSSGYTVKLEAWGIPIDWGEDRGERGGGGE